MNIAVKIDEARVERSDISLLCGQRLAVVHMAHVRGRPNSSKPCRRGRVQIVAQCSSSSVCMCKDTAQLGLAHLQDASERSRAMVFHATPHKGFKFADAGLKSWMVGKQYQRLQITTHEFCECICPESRRVKPSRSSVRSCRPSSGACLQMQCCRYGGPLPSVLAHSLYMQVQVVPLTIGESAVR